MIFNTNFVDIEFDPYARNQKIAHLLCKASPVNFQGAWN